MFTYFKEQKVKISKALASYIEEQKRILTVNQKWSFDTYEKILTLASQGKMIRGGLVVLAYSLFKDNPPQAAFEVGAVMELFQTCFLIQDDIMDNDLFRRGLPTLHSQYQKKAEQDNMQDPPHIGRSLGMCASDIALFKAFGILARIKTECRVHRKLSALFVQEFTHVGIAQMMDVFYAYSKNTISEDEVLHIYLYKTGRYTFSLPLMAGAILAHQPDSTVDALSELGEHIGIIFQIKDDELGLFGDQEQTGKPVGSDIREGKKTIFYINLLKKADEKVKERLYSLFGNNTITKSEIGEVRNYIIDLGVKDEIDKKLKGYVEKATHIIDSLSGDNSDKWDYIRQLIRYNLTRVK